MLSQEGVYYYVSLDLWSEQRLKGGFTLQKRQSVFHHPKQCGRSGFNHFLTSSPLGPPPILITDLLQAIGSNLFFTDNCLSKCESKSLICENEVIWGVFNCQNSKKLWIKSTRFLHLAPIGSKSFRNFKHPSTSLATYCTLFMAKFG
jgi:hypothetical protein